MQQVGATGIQPRSSWIERRGGCISRGNIVFNVHWVRRGWKKDVYHMYHSIAVPSFPRHLVTPHDTLRHLMTPYTTPLRHIKTPTTRLRHVTTPCECLLCIFGRFRVKYLADSVSWSELNKYLAALEMHIASDSNS